MNARPTPELGPDDLAGTALLVNARRVANGSEPLTGPALDRAARLEQWTIEGRKHRAEAGRVRKDADGREVRRGVGIRLGLAPVGIAPGEDTPTDRHADPSALSPLEALRAEETAARIAEVVGPEGWTLIQAKALEGREGAALAQAYADAYPHTNLGMDCRWYAWHWATLEDHQRRAATKPLRYRLGKARAALSAALAPGGVLDDLGADGWAPKAPRGGKR